MSRFAAEDGRLVYVGNLPDDVREKDIDELFGKYGRIISVDIKTPARPPPFAFVEFEDRRDAEDAVRARDGYDFYGYKLRVEIAKGRARDVGRNDRAGPRDFRAPNTGYRVLVRGLPQSASWQDLKDHFRQVVRPAYTNIMRERDGVVGIVEFDNGEDMERAIRKLDDTEFRNPFDRGYIRLIEDRPGYGGRSGGGGGGGRGRSPPRGRSRSRSRSPRGRSRSRTPRRRGGSVSDDDDKLRREPSRSASPPPRRATPSPSPPPRD